MKIRLILASAVIALSSSFALADNGDHESLSGKAMHDLPGNNGGGITANATSKPQESSLSGQAMRDLPGNNGGGKTKTTHGNGDVTSLSGKAMSDLPGNK
jgi:hypothetical protein